MTDSAEFRVTVAALCKQRGRLYRVTWDDGEQTDVYRPTWDTFGYTVGDSLREEEREALLRQAAEERAKEYAVWLLSQRDYSQTELSRKLRQKVGKEKAETAAQRMEELGLVNDERYARRLARDLCLRKHYPRRRAVEALAAKGIDRDTAKAAVEETNSDDVQQALALLEKKWYTATCDEKKRLQIRDSLIRYGFSYETVRAATALAERE